jgi:hemoglobin
MDQELTIFEMAGGEEAFNRLAAAFYEGIAEDELLRPMYPERLEPACRRLALFLIQYFGGPTTYSDERGHPRLRMRHAPYKIGLTEREHWLKHMNAALEKADIPQPAREVMRNYFTSTATFLMNVPPVITLNNYSGGK